MEGFCPKFPQAMSFKRIFYPQPRFHVSEFLTCVVLVSKLIWTGPISEYVNLRVISVVAKFHAFIISLNNSVIFLVNNSWNIVYAAPDNL